MRSNIYMCPCDTAIHFDSKNWRCICYVNTAESIIHDDLSVRLITPQISLWSFESQDFCFTTLIVMINIIRFIVFTSLFHFCLGYLTYVESTNSYSCCPYHKFVAIKSNISTRLRKLSSGTSGDESMLLNVQSMACDVVCQPDTRISTGDCYRKANTSIRRVQKCLWLRCYRLISPSWNDNSNK